MDGPSGGHARRAHRCRLGAAAADAGGDRAGFVLPHRAPGTDIADETATAVEGATSGRGLRPFSTVHLRMRRDGGDRVFSWIRRTRLGGDDWSAETVPLGEESELYRIEVAVGGAVVRRLDVGEPRWRYDRRGGARGFRRRAARRRRCAGRPDRGGYGAGTAREIGFDG